MRLPDPADLHRAAGIFKGLAHPARLELLCCLARGRPATQKQLLTELAWPQSTMARHLGVLRDRGLVRGTRRGNQVYLELQGTVTPKLLTAVCQWVHPDTREHFTSRLTPRAGRQA